jgi:hypothetical protein
MSNSSHVSESGPGHSDQPSNELAVARQSLFETIVAHARDELRHAHPLVKVAAELIDTERVKSPLPTGDGSTLPPKLREFVRRSLIEDALWEVRHGTPPPIPDEPDIPLELSPEELQSEDYRIWQEIWQQWDEEHNITPSTDASRLLFSQQDDRNDTPPSPETPH